MPADAGDRYRWRALAVATLAFGSFAVVLVGVPVLAPHLRDRFDLSLAEVGLMLACAEVGMAVALMAWGGAADRFGERATLVAGLLGGGLAIAGAAFAPTVPVFFGALTLAGACGAAVSTSGPRIVLGQFAARERGQALAIRQTAVPVTGIFVALLLGPLAVRAGTEAALVLLAVPMLGAAALAARGLRADRHRLGVAGAAPAIHPLRDRQVLRVSLAGGVMLAGQAILIGFTTVFLVDVRGMPTVVAGAVVAAALALGAGLLLVISRWSDRHGRRLRPFRWISAALALGFAAIGALHAGPAWLVAALLAVTGGISLSWTPLPTALLGALVARRRHGAAMGLQQTCLAVSAAISPVLFGWAAEALSWTAGFGAMSLVALLPALLVVGLDESPG